MHLLAGGLQGLLISMEQGWQGHPNPGEPAAEGKGGRIAQSDLLRITGPAAGSEASEIAGKKLTVNRGSFKRSDIEKREPGSQRGHRLFADGSPPRDRPINRRCI